MPIYQQIPIRLQASLVSAPPVAPIDINTGVAPRFWRAQGISVAFAVFDAFGVAVNLSNIASLTMRLQEYQNSLTPVFEEIIDAADIIPTITRAGWQNGLQQQATFLLTAAETDVSLAGGNEKPYWLSIIGLTEDAELIVYAAGYVAFFNPGQTFARAPFGFISRGERTNSAGNTTITPTSFNHTEFITVNGGTRTSQVILSIAGMEDGALLRLYFELPATADIILNVVNAALNGDQLSTVTTGSVLNGLFTYCYDADGQTWQPINYALPST